MCLQRKCRRQIGVCWSAGHGIVASAAHMWTTTCLLNKALWCLRHTIGRPSGVSAGRSSKVSVAHTWAPPTGVCWTEQHGVCGTHLDGHVVSAGHGNMVSATHIWSATWCLLGTASWCLRHTCALRGGVLRAPQDSVFGAHLVD